MKLRPSKKSRILAVALPLSLTILTGCGDDINNPSPQLVADCAGENCGAIDHQYNGSGVGIWTYWNRGTKHQSLKVDLSGLKNNQVTLVFSNLGNKTQTMPHGLTPRGILPPPPRPSFELNTLDPIPTDISTSAATRHETRTWKVPQLNEKNVVDHVADFPATLRGETEINGFTYKLWVTDNQWTPQMQKNAPILTAMLFGTPGYPGLLPQYVKDFGVTPWGPYPDTKDNKLLIPPDTHSVNLLLAPIGTSSIQFFNSAQQSKIPSSNEALMVFGGSASLSCKDGSDTFCIDLQSRELSFSLTNNLLHELTHLIHYYHRPVLLGADRRYETWLEEATASAHGYTVSMSRFPHTIPFFQEFRPWFSGAYECPLTSIEGSPGTQIQGSACSQNYYFSGQAFLLFLVNQYGTGFYRNLLNAKGTGVDALDEAIHASGGTGFEDAFRRWGGMLALLDATKLPKGYGYPGTRVGSFNLPAINGLDFAPYRRLPKTLPDTIRPYSHLPLVDSNQSGTYSREIDIPPNVALTVYVQ